MVIIKGWGHGKVINIVVAIVTILLLFTEGSKISKDTIRENAYNHLDSNTRSTISEPESATIKIRKYNNDHLVAKSISESINIKDKKIYQVTFKTNNEVLGPIIVYLDKDSLEVLGIDFRE